MGSNRKALSPDHCEYPDCDWPYDIQRHRIHPGSEGGKYKRGNVISLCPNHHWMSDRQIIERTTLQELVQRRLDVEAEVPDQDSE